MLDPQFLQGSLGPLFAIYYSPNPAVPKRGDILYIHPFAEELNKSRRMVALQAQRFAAKGFGILMPDLYGCGDSSGNFAEARWEVWLEDLAYCLDWLQIYNKCPLYLWGLRLGGLLATELIKKTEGRITGLILWQPVISGEQMLTQFLRLRLAADMMSGSRETTGQLREMLTAGHSLEVAGYELSPALAMALDQARLQPPSITDRIVVDWFDLVTVPGRSLTPASKRVVENWQAAGVHVKAQALLGEPFWSTQEITLVPALLEATTANLIKDDYC